MSEPEIARRCPSCGASIRDLALFCPQCGKEIPKRDPSQTQPLVTPPAEEKLLRDTAPAGDQADTETARARVGQTALGAVGAKIHRATTLARDVEGDMIHRARKVREISSVVLDEAGYDPGLRFVLVAAVLFLLFLLIVLLNRLIT